ncbi:terminase large subunit domain-containing protein [Klebsiella variicola]|uniref:terminase large subunit domain-containing protein n=1 Tax=Klebsiella variicola TaxID=244366 RepID=UPI001D10B65B|nr:terminase family protein [Klebsiella variicola]
MAIAPTLNIPQAKFLAMQYKFKAYVAGFGSGKTWVGCGGICKGMWEHPKINQGYFAPTYPQIRDIFYPTVEEVAHDWGLNVKINEGNKEVHFYAGRQYRGTTICRSMEKPQTATLTPADSTDTVQWTSSDPTIASVVSTGQKTAKVTRNAAGTATITGKARTFTATSEIIVTAP